MDDGPESLSFASQMATEVLRKSFNTARGLFLSSSCKVFPSQVKLASVILYILMFVNFAI